MLLVLTSAFKNRDSGVSGKANLDRTPPASRPRKDAVLVGMALAFAVLGSTGAQAQNCNGSSIISLGGNPVDGGNVSSFAASTAANLAAAISTANTAFLTQSTAFVGTPANALPDLRRHLL
jgi:hypothetical protein